MMPASSSWRCRVASTRPQVEAEQLNTTVNRVGCTVRPMFNRSKDKPGDGDTGGAPAADLWQQIEATLTEVRALSLVQRATWLLSNISTNVQASDQRAQMSSLLAKWVPDFGMDYTPDQWDEWHDLQLLLQEAFQVLVLTRLLVRREGADRFGTVVGYTLSADGAAALGAGNAAEVITRRLPD